MRITDNKETTPIVAALEASAESVDRAASPTSFALPHSRTIRRSSGTAIKMKPLGIKPNPRSQTRVVPMWVGSLSPTPHCPPAPSPTLRNSSHLGGIISASSALAPRSAAPGERQAPARPHALSVTLLRVHHFRFRFCTSVRPSTAFRADHFVINHLWPLSASVSFAAFASHTPSPATETDAG
jgi:hypothetical protein